MAQTSKEQVAISDKYNRVFSEDFKKSKVKDIINKTISIKDICTLYEISRTSVYKWIYLYGNIEKGVKTVVQMDSEVTKTKYLTQRVAELERIVGQKQLEVDFLTKLIALAGEDLGYDLKKKVRTNTIEWFRLHKKAHNYELNDIYLYNSISKQGHYENIKRQTLQIAKEPAYIGFIETIREMHPGMGLRKMYEQFSQKGLVEMLLFHLD